MDLRVEKTRRAIKNAYMKLLHEKNPEQITVKELCKEAEIDKSTFYLHYHDLLDLCDYLQQEMVRQILSCISLPAASLENLPVFFDELRRSMAGEWETCSLLFSGSHRLMMPIMLEQEFKKRFFDRYPQHRDDVHLNVMLSFLIFGSYYSFLENYPRFGVEPVVQAVQHVHETLSIMNHLKE